MTTIEVISLIVTSIGVISFAIVFTVLYSTYTSTSVDDITTGKKDIEVLEEHFYEQQPKVQKRRKVSGFFKSLGFYLSMLIFIPAFVFSLVNRFQGNTTMINNKGIMVVSSPSMSKKHSSNDYLITNELNNQFDKYDIIILDKVKSEADIKQFDVIAFRNNKGINIIHRVKEIKVVDGITKYVTRGDANNTTDSYEPTFKDIIGKYTNNRVKTVGIFVIFFQSYSGIITIAAVIYCLFMFDKLNNKLQDAQENRLNLLLESIEFDSDEDGSNITSSFTQELIYKDKVFVFKDNKLVEKNGQFLAQDTQEEGGK